MDILIKESQMLFLLNITKVSGLKEYFDPIYYLKNKFSKKPEGIRDQNLIPFEAKFQKIVDIIFKLTSKRGKVKHLKGFKVLKVTPLDKWTILIEPIVDDWFNWRENNEFNKELDNFIQRFRETARYGGFDNPHDQEGLPNEIEFSIWK